MAAESTWPELHIAIISNASTLFPSFSSKKLCDGDADKITLAKIRSYAAISEKLQFTADNKSILSDDTTLSYYVSLTKAKADGKKKEEGKGEKEGRQSKEGKPAGGDVAAEPAAGAADPGNGKENKVEEQKKPAIKRPAPKPPAIKTIKVKLILKSTTSKPVDAMELQARVDTVLANMKSDGAVRLGDLTKLSDSLGALKADSMDFAGVAGTVMHPEPLDLTEGQWDVVFRNNRALHGWNYKDGVMVKARKRAFRLKSRADDEPRDLQSSVESSITETVKQPKQKKEEKHSPQQKLEKGQNGASTGRQNQNESTQKTAEKKSSAPPAPIFGPLPPIPPFYVWDDAFVEVTEMTSALEKTMAKQGFSSTAFKVGLGAASPEIQGSAEGGTQTEHSEATKTLDTKQATSVHVAYKFPRAAVDVDAYSLRLTDECKQQAMSCRDQADVDRWLREYGTIFATQFTLGGELTSSRLFHDEDNGDLSAFKDSLKIAAGASISGGGMSLGASGSSYTSNENVTGDKIAQQSSRLTWQARGGNTLLCSNPPLWTNTVKDYRLWRLMDQQGLVNMIKLVRSIHPAAGAFLVSPMAASSRDWSADDHLRRKWHTLVDALKDLAAESPLAYQIKKAYEDKTFKLGDYNASLSKDATKKLAMTEKKSWPDLSMEQKLSIGLVCYDKGFITLELEGS